MLHTATGRQCCGTGDPDRLNGEVKRRGGGVRIRSGRCNHGGGRGNWADRNQKAPDELLGAPWKAWKCGSLGCGRNRYRQFLRHSKDVFVTRFGFVMVLDFCAMDGYTDSKNNNK